MFECFLLPAPVLCAQYINDSSPPWSTLLGCFVLVLLPSTYDGIRTLGVPLLPLLRSISEPAKLMCVSPFTNAPTVSQQFVTRRFWSDGFHKLVAIDGTYFDLTPWAQHDSKNFVIRFPELCNRDPNVVRLWYTTVVVHCVAYSVFFPLGYHFMLHPRVKDSIVETVRMMIFLVNLVLKSRFVIYS